ncbi:MAG: phosphate regulon sensor histidine kinase PhoR [Alcaligenaceae bacterium]|nr:phosphate regulon sensor histidine kinase PhoR [Alcaligenaceae bacterium]
MIKSLVTVTLWGLTGWTVASWISLTAGWVVFTGGLILMILASAMQLSQIRRWVRNLDNPPPVSVGPWNEILAPIYRKLKKNREEISELNKHIDAIMSAAEALPDGAVTMDDNMLVTWCNGIACEHLGLNLETDRNQSLFNILRDPVFLKYARQPEWTAPVLLHLNRDGQEKALLVQLTRYGQGQFLLVTRDVTQVEKLETTRRDFVANVSHELRTPLTVLLGFLETLRDMPDGSLTPEQKEYYNNLMFEQAQRMQAIVADLLTLSTLESSPTADGDPVDMAQVIRTALEQARVLSNGQHVFVTNLAEDLYLKGMETELASVVSNLLTNAIRYTPKDGTITVSWYKTEQGQACYSVQDTGIGIAGNDIPRLTERFYRVDRGRSRATGGTGLGLAITKHVVMRHNAELNIQSRIGAGSLFTVTFPRNRIVQDAA